MDDICLREECQSIKDTELAIEHKLHEMRVNMYYNYDLDAIFYMSHDSVIEEENEAPSLSSSENAMAISKKGILVGLTPLYIY